MAGLKRHKRILHPKTMLKKIIVKTNEKEESDKINIIVCNHKTNSKPCNLSFPSYHQLLKHKKNWVINRIRNPQEKAKEHHEKRAKLAKKNAIEKSNISNYFSKIQNEATTSDTDSDNNPAEKTKISSNESESEN